RAFGPSGARPSRPRLAKSGIEWLLPRSRGGRPIAQRADPGSASRRHPAGSSPPPPGNSNTATRPRKRPGSTGRVARREGWMAPAGGDGRGAARRGFARSLLAVADPAAHPSLLPTDLATTFPSATTGHGPSSNGRPARFGDPLVDLGKPRIISDGRPRGKV